MKIDLNKANSLLTVFNTLFNLVVLIFLGFLSYAVIEIFLLSKKSNELKVHILSNQDSILKKETQIISNQEEVKLRLIRIEMNQHK